MNKLTLEKIATSLLKACKDEGVMYKEAAKIFNTEPAYFKMLEREDKREAIPEKVMDRFHSWVYSGQTLKEYKMPKNFEEERQLADACLVNRMNEEMGALLMAGERVTLPYPSEEPRIKVKTEALAKRKKELAEKKPRKKYTRKPKENTPDYAKAIRESRPASTICDYVIKRTTPEVTEKILADAPVPADKHYAEAAPDVINNLKNENHSLRQLLLDATRVNEGLISQVSFLEALKKTHSDAMYNDGYTIMRLKKKIKKLKRRYRL